MGRFDRLQLKHTVRMQSSFIPESPKECILLYRYLLLWSLTGVFFLKCFSEWTCNQWTAFTGQ